MFLIKTGTVKKLISYVLSVTFALCISATFFVEAYGRGENDTEEAELITSDTTEVIFEDVVGHWGEIYINEVAKKHLLDGDSFGHFNPDENVTRGQFVTALWRMSGSPLAECQSTFTDLEEQTEETCFAIAWAQKNGYINGKTETSFEPESFLTREEAMKVLHLHSGDGKSDFLKFSLIYQKTFSDSSEISSWAVKPMYWGIYNGLLIGTSETTLSPQMMLTRAQLSKILMKYIEIIG